MRDELRHIALSVSEPHPGVFRWVMLEDVEGIGRWAEIEKSDICYSSYLGALGGGVFELDLMGIGSRGPRTGMPHGQGANPLHGTSAGAP